jgi:recombination protein RecA
MDDKLKLIKDTVKSINETFGDGAAKTLEGAFEPNELRGFIPTNNPVLDWVIGKPGIPLGRISEINGKFGCGKSSVTASILGNAQKNNCIAVLIDAENSYDPTWSNIHKVVSDELIYINPPHLQGVFDEAIVIINEVRKKQSEVPIIIAIDSVSAIPTASELEIEDSTASSQSAEHAVIISKGLRRLQKLIHDQNVAILFISQLKENPRASWGKTTSKIGGSAIDFSAGLVLELARTKYIEKEGKKVGQTIQVTSRKNKFNFHDPLRVRTMDLYYREGFRPKEMLVDFMVELGMITAKGAWYDFEGSKYHKQDLAEKLSDESLMVDIYQKLEIK